MYFARSGLTLAAALWLFACAAEPPVEEALGQAEQALAPEAAACSRDTLRNQLTWSSPGVQNEACEGVWSYVRYKQCQVTSFLCGSRAVEHRETRTQTVTQVAASCTTRCVRKVLGICVDRETTCVPDTASGATKCSQAAQAYRSAVGGMSVETYSAYGYVGPTNNTYRASCTFRVRLANTYEPLSCARYDASCGQTRVVSPSGLTYAQADALVGSHAGDAMWDTIEGIYTADLRCTSCEALPLPVEGAPRQMSDFDLVRAKFQCLWDRRALAVTSEARAVSDRNLVQLYELWGDLLEDAQRASMWEPYGAFERMPQVAACGRSAALPNLPATCPVSMQAKLLGNLRRCQRLSSSHIDAYERGLDKLYCWVARNDNIQTPGCQSAEYTAAIDDALDAITDLEPPRWNEPSGSTTDATTVQGERWVRETVVGVAPRGFTCPTPADGSGWSGGFMFGQRPVEEQPLDDEGGLFCRYEYNGPAGQVAWDALPAQSVCSQPGVICGRVPGAAWLHPDARVATAQAPALFEQVAARLRSEYLDQLDVPLAGAPVASSNKVDLAILDSLGDSQAGQDYPLGGTGHGRALAMAAYRSACPAGLGDACPVNFRFYRAFEPGTVASLSDLAAKIVQAVDDARARGTRLVLNVSLGLHPRFAWWDRPGANPDAPQGVLLPAFRAVKSALNYASAYGAITIAAAGNTDGADAVPEDERSDELLYPAAFDGESGWTCDANRKCTAAARPLVLAAGGVTREGEQLPNARFSRHPVPFVAAACNVALDNQLPWEPAQPELPVFCGTSFGAIGVSSVLAATWAYLPGASADEVLDTVRAGGLDGESGQPGCVGHDCKVRMCAALRAAGAPVTCGTRAATVVDSQALQSFVATSAVTTSWLGGGVSDETDQVCASDVVYSGSRNADACPARNYQSALPNSEILVDQPPSGRCPQCGITIMANDDGSTTPYLVGTTEPATGETISSSSLKLDGRIYELDAPLGPLLQYGGSFALPLLSTSGSAPAGTGVATLSYLRTPASGPANAQLDPLPVLR